MQVLLLQESFLGFKTGTPLKNKFPIENWQMGPNETPKFLQGKRHCLDTNLPFGKHFGFSL